MGRYFGVEPAQFLRGNHLEWAVNVAAYDVASKAEAEANRRSAGKMPSTRGMRR
jgi:hypothetical protein